MPFDGQLTELKWEFGKPEGADGGPTSVHALWVIAAPAGRAVSPPNEMARANERPVARGSRDFRRLVALMVRPPAATVEAVAFDRGRTLQGMRAVMSHDLETLGCPVAVTLSVPRTDHLIERKARAHPWNALKVHG